jgi:hypothetical protein
VKYVIVKNSSTGFLFLWGISAAAWLTAHTGSAMEINGREAETQGAKGVRASSTPAESL